MFSCSFYILFVGFQSIHAFLIYFSKIFTRLLFAPSAFSMYFSKSFTRLLHFPIVFAPFPLVVIAFSCTFIFYYMFPIIFTSFLHRFLHHFLWFPAFSYLFNININPRVLPVSFIFRSFLHHFLSLLSHFPALSLYFSSMFTVSSWFAPGIRSGFLHFPRDFHGFSMVCS